MIHVRAEDAATARADVRHAEWERLRRDVGRAEALAPLVSAAAAPLALRLRLAIAHVKVVLNDGEAAAAVLSEAEAILERRPEFRLLAREALELRGRVEAGRAGDGAWAATLTPAELRLLPLLTTHLSFREIAESLYVSRNTVKTQAISVYRKLGVQSRAEAIERAAGVGLVMQPPQQ